MQSNWALADYLGELPSTADIEINPGQEVGVASDGDGPTQSEPLNTTKPNIVSQHSSLAI